MKKALSIFFLISMVFMSACKDKNAKPADDQDILGQVSRPGARDPQSTAGKLNQAATASDNGLVWAGDKDAVCGMKISREAEDTVHYQGKIFGFCSGSCKKSFQENPQKWVSKDVNQ